MEAAPGTLRAPVQRTRTRPKSIGLALAVLVLIAVAAVVVLSNSGSNGESDAETPETTGEVLLTGSALESKLDAELGSQSTDPISDVSCPSDNLYAGDSIDCEVTFGSGRTQGIEATITGTAGSPRIDISLR